MASNLGLQRVWLWLLAANPGLQRVWQRHLAANPGLQRVWQRHLRANLGLPSVWLKVARKKLISCFARRFKCKCFPNVMQCMLHNTWRYSHENMYSPSARNFEFKLDGGNSTNVTDCVYVKVSSQFLSSRSARNFEFKFDRENSTNVTDCFVLFLRRLHKCVPIM